MPQIFTVIEAVFLNTALSYLTSLFQSLLRKFDRCAVDSNYRSRT